MWKFTTFCFLNLIIIVKLGVHANSLVPCYFVFGDSLSDPGNNNGLKTKARANYQPYGVDFPGRKPTGRFTNGQTVVDVIAEHLEIKGCIQPYSTARGQEILKGVNYASGAAGIRPETGRHLGDIISLDMQFQNHKRIITKLNSMLNGTAHEHLQKCLYTVNIGSNDYINNYFMPEHYKTSRSYNPHRYAESLIFQYRDKLKNMYNNGARRVAVFGLGLVGCSLGQVVRNRPKTLCVDKINVAVSIFNSKLKTLVTEMNHKFPDAKFTLINTQAITIGPQQGVIGNNIKATLLVVGLTVLDRPCCQLREDFMCKESTAPCSNRSAHYFWDGYHPTEAVNKIMGSRAFKSLTPLEAQPLDISSLVKYKM